MARYLLAASAGMLAVGFATPASAQATRTWVSGFGDDANPCSRTAPCLTFAGAIAKTAAGGEINCLDRGEFGMLTITKAISIICEGGTGAIAAEISDEYYNGAIVIEAGPNDSVFLSGLDVRGDMRAGHGGINFRSGKELHVRNSTFHYLGNCAISVAGPASVVIDNVTSTYNFCGLGFGINSIGKLDFLVSNVRIIDSGRLGVDVGATAAAGSISGVISDSQIATTLSDAWGFENHGLSVIATSGQVQMTVKNSSITGQPVGAIDARGSGARVMVSGTLIAHNQLGISSQGGAAVVSFGDNVLAGNVSDGIFTGSGTKK